MSYRDWDYYPPSRPREAKGGIKATTSRGAFGSNWWAKRWIATLESFDIGARLGRGRKYARQGQVLSIEVQQGIVTAEVQGSRKTPYSVRITVKVLSQREWAKVGETLSQQAIFVAKLLGGQMPEEIEEVFEQAGLSLFPQRLSDLDTDCSCPDWSNPCKHIAAVYYLLGEEFDRDPFLIFRLRGMEREDLMELVGGAAPEAETEEEPAPEPEPLPGDETAFWRGGHLPEDLLGEARTPPVTAVLAKRLGPFPFWRAQRPLQEYLEPVYDAASARGTQVVLAQRERDTQGDVEEQ